MRTVVLSTPDFTTVQQYAVEIFKKHYHVSRLAEAVGDGFSYFLIARPYSGLAFHQWLKIKGISEAAVKKISLTPNHTCTSNNRDMDVFAFTTKALADAFLAEQPKIVDTDTGILQLGTTYDYDTRPATDLNSARTAQVVEAG